MSVARRFAGAGLALVLLCGAVGLWLAVRAPAEGAVESAAIFRFEKEDLVGIRVTRPDLSLAFARSDEGWETVGESWRPSASMMRRVSHQLHDLTARAEVVDRPEAPERYGLGPDAIRVELDLRDGRTLSFAVGDPNPSSVSWYMQPLPDGPVYVVKKAAVDYYRMGAEAFREDRYASFDAADCEAIFAVVDGRELRFQRTGERSWEMRAPVQWRADRDRVQRILGAVAASRAMAFVADAPEDLSKWELGEGADGVTLSLSSGEPITLRFGALVPGSDPQLRYVWRAEDDAVYTARAAMLDPLTEPLEAYRDPKVFGAQSGQLVAIEASRGGERVAIAASADGWRWEEGAAIPGATPRRVASALTGLRATAFHDPPVGLALAEPLTAVALSFDDDTSVQLQIGASDGAARLVSVGGDPVLYEVSEELSDRLSDLFRERQRWLDKRDERR